MNYVTAYPSVPWALSDTVFSLLRSNYIVYFPYILHITRVPITDCIQCTIFVKGPPGPDGPDGQRGRGVSIHFHLSKAF